jgi:hypothetical protein
LEIEVFALRRVRMQPQEWAGIPIFVNREASGRSFCAPQLLDELAVTQFVILSGRLVPRWLLQMECSFTINANWASAQKADRIKNGSDDKFEFGRPFDQIGADAERAGVRNRAG